MNVLKFKDERSELPPVPFIPTNTVEFPNKIEPQPIEQPAEQPEEITITIPPPAPAPVEPSLVFKFLLGSWITIRALCKAVWLTARTIGRYLYRHPIHAALNLVFLVILGLLIVTGSEIHKQMILAKISEQTVDEIIKGSRFTRSYDSEDINRNGVREFLGVGAPEWAQREGVRAILFHARKAGLSIEDQAVLLAIADIESGFNPMARAPTTTACGLFQFVKRTGEAFDLSQSDCMNPWMNARAEIDHFIYNFERRVKQHVTSLDGAERVFRTFELSYYLHHDGPDSRNPSNDVKATILSGTQFLFKAYHALLQESESEQRAPTFMESFSTSLLRGLDRIASLFHNSGVPFISKLNDITAVE